MGFWIAGIALCSFVAALLVLAVLRPAGPAAAGAEADMNVYRDQLKELDRDVARGVVTEDEASRTRTEISRRLLDADAAAQAQGAGVVAPKLANWAGALFIGVFVVGLSLWLYAKLGAPGAPDLPLKARIAAAEESRATRPDQAAAEAATPTRQVAENPELETLIAQLRLALVDHPDDLQGHVLLAMNEARLGNFTAAHAAQKQVLEIKGDGAEAQDWSYYADLLILAAGGYVSPEAEVALGEALERDPKDGTARYYSGLMFLQIGRPDLGFRVWAELLEQSPPDAPWVPSIRANIGDAAALAGVDYALPEAAQTPDEEMIRGMVEGLADRLASEGGTGAEWARLIHALGVLGEIDRARAIWHEARTTFADDAEALGMINAAAERAGLSQ